MTSTVAATAARRSSAVRPVDQPIAWVGADRILLDDTSRFGLRRKVIVRKGEPMDVEVWLAVVCKHWSAEEDQLRHWLVERDGYWFLWIAWKPRRGR